MYVCHVWRQQHHPNNFKYLFCFLHLSPFRFHFISFFFLFCFLSVWNIHLKFQRFICLNSNWQWTRWDLWIQLKSATFLFFSMFSVVYIYKLDTTHSFEWAKNVRFKPLLCYEILIINDSREGLAINKFFSFFLWLSGTRGDTISFNSSLDFFHLNSFFPFVYKLNRMENCDSSWWLRSWSILINLSRFLDLAFEWIEMISCW